MRKLHVEFYPSGQAGAFDAYGTADMTPGLPAWAAQVELAVAEWHPLQPRHFVSIETIRVLYDDGVKA